MPQQRPVPPKRPLVRSDCGLTVWLSARNALNWDGRRYVCTDCRTAPITLTDEERVRYQRWWRENTTPAELARLTQAVAFLAAS